jgi:hypothetical protein
MYVVTQFIDYGDPQLKPFLDGRNIIEKSYKALYVTLKWNGLSLLLIEGLTAEMTTVQTKRILQNMEMHVEKRGTAPH